MSDEIAELKEEIERLNATISVLQDAELMAQINDSRDDYNPRTLSEILNPDGVCETCYTGPEDKKDSIEVSRTAKGYTWKIKQYHAPGTENITEALDNISGIDAQLRQTYTNGAEL